MKTDKKKQLREVKYQLSQVLETISIHEQIKETVILFMNTDNKCKFDWNNETSEIVQKQILRFADMMHKESK